MAKSAKAKKEKKKDFQKAKLKVGKTKPKASNFTDTSFKARSINVLQQSLATSAPSTVTQFNHHLAILGHKSEQQRSQSLSHLTSVVQNCQQNTIALPQPASVIIAKVQPLVRDASAAVRSQVLKLLRFLPGEDIKAHTEGMLLWIRLGMTNLGASVRLGALDVLEWLCEVAGQEAVSCAGGWSKTLKCFSGILGWDVVATAASKDGKSSWTSAPNTSSKGTVDSKLLLRTLAVLTVFLQHGLLPPQQDGVDAEEARRAVSEFPLWQSRQHMLPVRMASSNPYGYLDLFGTPKDEEGNAYEGWEERAVYFDEKWRKSFEDGVAKVARDGGGVGRAAIGLAKVMKSAKEVLMEDEDVL